MAQTHCEVKQADEDWVLLMCGCCYYIITGSIFMKMVFLVNLLLAKYVFWTLLIVAEVKEIPW